MTKQGQDKICFVIGPIGKPGSDTRTRADQLYKHVIEPVCETFGYAPTRADRIAQSGMITNQIIRLLMDADLVIADLSERNPNVFYELAFRHALNKPVLHLIDRHETLPFDLSNVRTVEVNLSDPDKLLEARAELTEQLSEMINKKHPLENPITSSSGITLAVHEEGNLDIDKTYNIEEGDGHFFLSIRIPEGQPRNAFVPGRISTWQRLSLEDKGVMASMLRTSLRTAEALIDEFQRFEKPADERSSK